MRQRVLISLLGCCVTAALAADDARVTYLTRQLSGTSDPRVKAQTLLLMGQTGSDAVVPVVCGALQDPEPVVRGAAASALGDLRTDASVQCLKQRLGEADPAVRSALEKALGQEALAPGALYVQVDPVEDKVGDLPVPLAEKLLKDKLALFGAGFAPPNEDKKAASALVRSRHLKGYELRLRLLPGATEKGLKVEMLIMSYPDQALKGTWNVKAAGGKPESLIKAMVPRVLDDAAADLDWKNAK